MRASNPPFVALDATLIRHREELADAWLVWIQERMAMAPAAHPPAVRRLLSLVIDSLVLMSGPHRRSAREVWYTICELYGRAAATRGLATGEVVEELQYFRELLIRTLADSLASLSARQLMATVIRLNRVLDKGIATAVVSYTDELITTLFAQRGVPVSGAEEGTGETDKQLAALEAEVAKLASR